MRHLPGLLLLFFIGRFFKSLPGKQAAVCEPCVGLGRDIGCIGEGTFRNDDVAHRRTFCNVGCHRSFRPLGRIALGRFITFFLLSAVERYVDVPTDRETVQVW
jgi:hypothetical protein